MNYFEIKANREIRENMRSVRKNYFWSLLPVARGIKDGRVNTDGLEFFIKGKAVSADLYADTIFAMKDAFVEKQERETKLIFIQEGVCGFSGYYKRIKKVDAA